MAAEGRISSACLARCTAPTKRGCGVGCEQGRGRGREAARTLRGSGVTAAAPSDASARAFRLEQFRDHLALEAGNSAHTVTNYLRDVRRLAGYAARAGAERPEDLTRGPPREVGYALNDLGL